MWPSPPSRHPPVLLLHGIWNTRSWLIPLAWRLRTQGFKVEIFGYPSVSGGPGVAVPLLVERLRGHGPVNLVGHSLGGLVALEALRQAPELEVPRVVCLGSPLCGSGTARTLAEHGWSAALGRSSELLLQGLPEWHGNAQVGLIAGSVAHGLGALMGALHGDSDGTVALDETCLSGLADHCIVPSSHSGLVLSQDAATLTAAFLKLGRFPAEAVRRGT
ncbi:alpha/beta hydrolase [Stenotrophomonas sp. SY1]|uniref:esterase/lipase family protein n=1 Tax=Stenotrophomonas sp. SY1 TaxID=477235 RepID=UPI001E591F95|nr:alpha/beta hydrolase [Stenotrophomonas sp. SY1]MCD9086195.1 alpha/beta hydrolase [Stenotrophomonas sp. SY1]